MAGKGIQLPASRRWWLVGNNAGGMHVGHGRTPAEALRYVRTSIAETFTDEGHSPTAARRGAASYQVCVVAGGLTNDEAHSARAAWEVDHYQPVEALRGRWQREKQQRRTEQARARRAARAAL